MIPSLHQFYYKNEGFGKTFIKIRSVSIVRHLQYNSDREKSIQSSVHLTLASPKGLAFLCATVDVC